MTSITKAATSTEIARPLKVLIPLIKQDIEEGEKAGMAYYKQAGGKLNEARDGHFEGDSAGFYRWAEKTFGKSPKTIRTYMAYAAGPTRKSFESLKHFRRESLGEKDHPIGPGSRIHRDWTAPVDAVAEKARAEQQRLFAAEELTRREERDAEAKLALRLIDIGYKVLARELHPDKMRTGSREAMQRLNRVRDRLKANV